MNLEELSLLGGQFCGGAIGAWQGFTQMGISGAIGGVLIGSFVGWTMSFLPLLAAAASEEKKRIKPTHFFLTIGFLAPLTAPLVMWWVASMIF